MNQHKFINPGVTVIVIHWGEEHCSMVLKLTLPFSAVLQAQDCELLAALKSCIFLYILPSFELKCVRNSGFIFLFIKRLFRVRSVLLTSCICRTTLTILQS